MKQLYIILLIAFSTSLYAQNEFLNGSFEQNPWSSVGVDWIDNEQELINLGMEGVYSFGTDANMDMITSTGFSGGAEEGDYYCAISGGGTDMLTLEVDPPFVFNQEYAILYHDKSHTGITAFPLTFGVSDGDDDLGITVFESTIVPTDGDWTARIFVFTAPANGSYLSVQMPEGTLASWHHIDNFQFTDPDAINESEEDEELLVYPNPAENYIFVDNSSAKLSQFRVYNLIGQVVKEENELSATEMRIDLSDLETGNYIIEFVFEEDGKIKRTRFVKK